MRSQRDFITLSIVEASETEKKKRADVQDLRVVPYGYSESSPKSNLKVISQ